MLLDSVVLLHIHVNVDVLTSALRQDIPPMVVKAEKMIFVALCNDLIDYFIVCFEHQCNTMRAF